MKISSLGQSHTGGYGNGVAQSKASRLRSFLGDLTGNLTEGVADPEFSHFSLGRRRIRHDLGAGEKTIDDLFDFALLILG